MRIISTFLPAEPAEELIKGQPALLMAFDTLVDDKSLIVGFTVGQIGGPTVDGLALSKPGLLILDRCRRHMQLNYPQGAVVIAGVATTAGAKQRVRQVLAHAAPQSFVLLVCSDNKVYDAAFPALGIDLKSVDTNPQ